MFKITIQPCIANRAIEVAYEQIVHLSPYNADDFLYAHRLMTQGLVDETGMFRRSDVGIFNNRGEVISMGAHALTLCLNS